MYTGYTAKTLPGIREAAEDKRYDEASAQVIALKNVLRAYTEAVNEAAKVLTSP
jgi:N-acetylated-alpha-linked acidic dipeptidase